MGATITLYANFLHPQLTYGKGRFLYEASHFPAKGNVTHEKRAKDFVDYLIEALGYSNITP